MMLKKNLKFLHGYGHLWWETGCKFNRDTYIQELICKRKENEFFEFSMFFELVEASYEIKITITQPPLLTPLGAELMLQYHDMKKCQSVATRYFGGPDRRCYYCTFDDLKWNELPKDVLKLFTETQDKQDNKDQSETTSNSVKNDSFN